MYVCARVWDIALKSGADAFRGVSPSAEWNRPLSLQTPCLMLWVPAMHWIVVITRCRALLSWAEHITCPVCLGCFSCYKVYLIKIHCYNRSSMNSPR